MGELLQVCEQHGTGVCQTKKDKRARTSDIMHGPERQQQKAHTLRGLILTWSWHFCPCQWQ